MIPVTAKTRMRHRAFVLLDRRGEEELLLVAKATFSFDTRGGLRVADEQVPWSSSIVIGESRGGRVSGMSLIFQPARVL